ncbi:MAG: hypothetical protein WA775_05355 [Psychroserpens sp.]|uniref:hypothetical protein n=1 Tax=Psychroserpens sp. TaxID=2020870 RepID=UPI003C8AF6AD
MILSHMQIEYIENSLSLHGVTSKDLRDDLLDHICTYIEARNSNDFNALYQEALQKFGGYNSFQNLQRESIHQRFVKQALTIHKLKFSFGVLVIVLLIIGFVFQIMHWPYANAWLLSAILVAALVILPIHCYAQYKKSIHHHC